MKAINRRARFLAICLALGACLTVFGSLPLALASEEKKDSSTFTEKMKKWQDEMTDKFRDTWKGWHGRNAEPSVATASIDLREQKDSYTVRLNLPKRDLEKVKIGLEGNELHIMAPAEEKAARYEQTIALADVAADAKPQIERKQKDNLIVVTVPKGAAVAQASPSSTIPDPSLLPLADWDRDILERMEKMRREMNRIFDESFHDFGMMPQYKDFFDLQHFGSSLDLKEEGENYVVSAYLPNRDMKNVNVTVDDKNILKIEARSEETEKKEGTGTVKSSKEEYAQVLTLPGPVQMDKMKVDKKEGMLVVTLPKAR